MKRDAGNRRVFDERDVAWIKSLTCLKQCGMSIQEMKHYLALCLEGERSIPERKMLLAEKREQLLERIRELEDSVDYIDHKQKNAFLGDYVHYTPLDAIAYGKAIGKEFSQGDTLFVHADTILMKGIVENKKIGERTVQDTIRTFYGVNNVRAFRTDAQAVCGLLIACTRDSSMTMYKDPIVWSGQRQMFGDSIRCFMNDSTIREAHVMGNAMSIELMPDGEHYNQVSAKLMNGFFTDGKIRWGEAMGNVFVIYYPVDDKDSSLIGLNYTETDTMRFYMTPTVERKLQKIWMPKSKGTLYPMNQIPADKKTLKGFAWYDYIRPVDKYDLFRHASKGEQKISHRMAVTPPPLQYIGNSTTVVTDKGNRRQVLYPDTGGGKSRKER